MTSGNDRTIIIHGSNNGVHIFHPIDIRRTQRGEIQVAWNVCFVFAPEDHENYPYFTDNMVGMEYLVHNLPESMIDQCGQGYPVPFSNGPVPLEQTAKELGSLTAHNPNLRVGKASDLWNLVKMFGRAS